MINLTASATRHLHALIEEKGEPQKGLRIFVEKGGCAGLQYGMTLDEPSVDDTVLEEDGVKVIIDSESAAYVRGSTLDYSDDLAGAGFRLQNPNAARSCGCGTSFEPATDAQAGPG